MKESVAYLILFIGIMIIGLMPVHSSYPETITYYRIDSISMSHKYSMEPEVVYTYHTSFGPISAGNKLYNVGDSIPVKTIIIH